MVINSDIIEKKIEEGNVIIYRRVSTKSQINSGYKRQLRRVKSKFPRFNIRKSVKLDIKEYISGKTSTKKRMTSSLGRAIDELIKNDDLILLVSDPDRLSRVRKVFEELEKKGLASRIYFADSGMRLDQIMTTSIISKIERSTIYQYKRMRTGIEARRQAGAEMGNPDISRYSSMASEENRGSAQRNKCKVLEVVRELATNNNDSTPSLAEICDELTRRRIFTRQGHRYDQRKLSKFKSQNSVEWTEAVAANDIPDASIELVEDPRVDNRGNASEVAGAANKSGRSKKFVDHCAGAIKNLRSKATEVRHHMPNFQSSRQITSYWKETVVGAFQMMMRRFRSPP